MVRLTLIHIQVRYAGCHFEVWNFWKCLNARRVSVAVNGTPIMDTAMDYFNDLVTTTTVPVSMFSSGIANIRYFNGSTVGTDRMVMSFSELTYPRLFTFGNQKNFEFELPAKAQGYYLEINGFAYTSPPSCMTLSIMNGLLEKYP
jgi:hypothetical protein